MTYYTYDEAQARMVDIVGSTVNAIYMGEDVLTLDTNKGRVAYMVEGDCCSQSYFFDFYGVKNLLENGPIVAFEEVDLAPGDPGYRAETWEGDGEDADDYGYEVIKVYGYRFTTNHPTFGPVSSVVSFRNRSNGYYGGWMERTDQQELYPDQVRLTEDKVGS